MKTGFRKRLDEILRGIAQSLAQFQGRCGGHAQFVGLHGRLLAVSAGPVKEQCDERRILMSARHQTEAGELDRRAVIGHCDLIGLKIGDGTIAVVLNHEIQQHLVGGKL